MFDKFVEKKYNTADVYNMFMFLASVLLVAEPKTDAKYIHLKMLSATGRTTLLVRTFFPPLCNVLKINMMLCVWSMKIYYSQVCPLAWPALLEWFNL